MRRMIVVLTAMAALLTGCGGASLEGSWQDNNGAMWTFRSGDSVTLRDTNGSTYSGKWREVGKGQVELALSGGLIGLAGSQVCGYEIATSGPTNLILSDCMFRGVYHKQ